MAHSMALPDLSLFGPVGAGGLPWTFLTEGLLAVVAAVLVATALDAVVVVFMGPAFGRWQRRGTRTADVPSVGKLKPIAPEAPITGNVPVSAVQSKATETTTALQPAAPVFDASPARPSEITRALGATGAAPKAPPVPPRALDSDADAKPSPSVSGVGVDADADGGEVATVPECTDAALDAVLDEMAARDAELDAALDALEAGSGPETPARDEPVTSSAPRNDGTPAIRREEKSGGIRRGFLLQGATKKPITQPAAAAAADSFISTPAEGADCAAAAASPVAGAECNLDAELDAALDAFDEEDRRLEVALDMIEARSSLPEAATSTD